MGDPLRRPCSGVPRNRHRTRLWSTSFVASAIQQERGVYLGAEGVPDHRDGDAERGAVVTES